MRRGFRRLVVAYVATQLGGQVTLVALPLVAVVSLGAGAFETGVLVALGRVAFVVIGLPAGAWVDGRRKLPVMVGADLARGVLLVTIPAAALLDAVTMPHLFAVALVAGVATVLFDLAHQSYLPHLLPRAELMAGNATLATIRSASDVAGPPLGGILVRLLTAPAAILADALAFLFSAKVLARIDAPEPRPATARRDRRIRDGFAFVLGDPGLRAALLIVSIGNFAFGAWYAIQPVFLVRDLRVDPAAYGLLLGVAAVGGIAGAALSARFARLLGGARYLLTAAAGAGLCFLLVPLTGPGPGLGWFVAGTFGTGFCLAGAGVAAVSYRQATCPPELLGRATAATRLLSMGTLPLGGFAGGAGAEWLGMRPTLWLCAAVLLAAPLPALLSPIRTWREFPVR
jgi:MFS family permease